MLKSNASRGRIPAVTFMRRNCRERMLLVVWLIAEFATSGGALASQPVPDTHVSDLCPWANKVAVVQLTESDNEARISTDALANGATAHVDLFGNEAGLLAGPDTDTDRRDDEEFSVIQAFPTTRGMLLILPQLAFRSGESRLSSSALPALEPLARFLIRHPDRRVEIDGFSDGLGSVQDNQALSQQRAEIVKSTLISRGATASQISAYGYGIQAPVSGNADPVGRRRNRRIEIIIGSSKHAAIPGWSDL